MLGMSIAPAQGSAQELKETPNETKLRIERNDLLVPILNDLPKAGLYWVEYIIHGEGDNPSKGNYTTLFATGMRPDDAFIYLHPNDGPDHLRYYPVINDPKTLDSLNKDIGYRKRIVGWELCNEDSCTDPQYRTPAIWKLVTRIE
jgi:hypothetical protein